MLTHEFAFEMRCGMNEFDHPVFALLGQGSNPPAGVHFSGLSCCCLIGTHFPFPFMLNGICKQGKAIKIGNPSQINWHGWYA